jgi:hypothetical protein
MQRNITYLSSVSLVIRGFYEFGMIFAESLIYLRARARDLNIFFYNLSIAVACFLHVAAFCVPAVFHHCGGLQPLSVVTSTLMAVFHPNRSPKFIIQIQIN